MMDQAQKLRQMMGEINGIPPKEGLQVITVTSAKGGVGKSSIALNMAIALSQKGKRVLLVDMDLGLANIDVMLGVRTQYDLSDVVSGEKDVRDIIETGLEGVCFISGGSGLEALLQMEGAQAEDILTRLLGLHDVIDILLFDTGAGISDFIVRLICASNITWLVTTPEPTAVMDAYALVKTVDKEPTKPDIQLIVNQASSVLEAQSAMEGFVRIVGKYTSVSIKELGYVMSDTAMVRAVKAQEPVLVSFPKSTAAGNIQNLASTFLQYPKKETAGLTRFFERLFRKRIGGLA